MKATLENYLEFVKTRKPSRKIDHDSWHTCSVGDFIARCTKKSRKSTKFQEAVINFLSKIIYQDTTLGIYLGNATQTNLPNYGALTKWLEDNGYIETKFEMGPNQKAWVEALRSGKYAQTRSVLQNRKGFCCLGVAADVANENGVKVVKAKGTDQLRGSLLSSSQLNTLNWLGLRTSSSLSKTIAMIDCRDLSLSESGLMLLNDGFRYSFEQIADFIEEHAEDLFTESK